MPNTAGTMMKTSRSVNHTVKEMPRSMQISPSKGKRYDSMAVETWTSEHSHTGTADCTAFRASVSEAGAETRPSWAQLQLQLCLLWTPGGKIQAKELKI